MESGCPIRTSGWLSKSAGSRTVEGLPLRRGVRPLERLFYSDRVLTSRYALGVEQIILFKKLSLFKLPLTT